MKERSTRTEKRYSVCIGINTYAPSSHLSELRYAENDARAIDEVLGNLGFEPEDRILLLGEQANLEAINNALYQMIVDQAGENDLVVFYFAGHGVPLLLEKEDQSEVFLTSYDFDRDLLIQRSSFRIRHGLGMERLRRDFFEGQGSRKRLFLLDSCYSGDFAGPSYREGAAETVQRRMQTMLDSKQTGRVALSSCLVEQVAEETAKYGHGRFTYYLLQALSGEASEALTRDGWLTANSLFEYLSHHLPERQRPVLSGVQHDVFELCCFPHLATYTENSPSSLTKKTPLGGREAFLRAVLADHTAFLHDRLASFVGRTQELEEIQQLIHDTVPTGGYISITGQAGQGKSSIMARLVEAYGVEKVAFHFIPFNPGPDHQVGLLRNLMARLILKYDLSDLYIATDSRAALRDYFPNVLREVVAKGGQEVLFVDGLDQIEEDLNGVRDLSFLPTNPPEGMVFVLATRPNDVLQPLALLKPHYHYQLPNLKRDDFDRILHRRQVHLDPHLADQFYEKMEENALYLDLVAKELQDHQDISLQEMIMRIAHNPDNIFSLSIKRLKCQPVEWREVIKPILGLLLVAHEPLAFWLFRQLFRVEDDRLRDGIARLGGLIQDHGGRRYTLFHLKFQDYLRQSEQGAEKDYVFASDEEEQYHDILAKWCEQGLLASIWEDSADEKEQKRRVYARQHYIKHLYGARLHEKLFRVLDEGNYGKAKERHDRTSRSYIQDLDLGRHAAIAYGKSMHNEIEALPLLWKYTLLRGSLRSQVDGYPDSLFEAFLLVHRERDVLGFIELLTEETKRITILLLLGFHFAKSGQQQESMQVFLRALSIARGIKEPHSRARNLSEIARALCQREQWEKAEEVIRAIEDSHIQASVLSEMARALSDKELWERAEKVTREIKTVSIREAALSELVKALSEAEQWERIEGVLREIDIPSYRAAALSEFARALGEAEQSEQMQLMIDEVEKVIRKITEPKEQVFALNRLARIVGMTQQWERMEAMLAQAEDVMKGIERLENQTAVLHDQTASNRWLETMISDEQVKTQETEQALRQIAALSSLADALGRANQWERVNILFTDLEELARGIENPEKQAEALSNLARALGDLRLWERAEEVAGGIEDLFQRAGALYNLAGKLNREELWERAEEVAKKIDQPLRRAEALEELSKAMGKRELWQRAEEVASAIEEPMNRAAALSDLAVALSKGGFWKRAEKVFINAEEALKKIENGTKKVGAMSELARALGKAEQWERAATLIVEAEEIVRGSKEFYKQWHVSRALSEILAQAEQWERAEEVVKEIDTPSIRASALVTLAETLAKGEQWGRSEKLFVEAGEAAIVIEELELQINVLREIAWGLGNAKLWEQAKRVIRKIEWKTSRAAALSELAETLAMAQHWDRAKEIIFEAQEIARTIEDIFSQVPALQALTRALSKVHQWESAENAAKEIAIPYFRALALIDLAEALGQAQQWERIETVAREMEKPADRVEVLSVLARELSEAGLWEQANKVLNGAELVLREIGESRERELILSEFARALGQARQWERAEEIARGIAWPARKMYAMGYIAKALSKAQQWARAESLFIQAEEASKDIDILHGRDIVLFDFVKVLIQAQQWERVEKMAREIEALDLRRWVLRELIEALVQAQQQHLVIGVIQRTWLLVETREHAFWHLSLVDTYIKKNHQLGIRLFDVSAEVDYLIY